MNLDDLKALCEVYVPISSRHPNSFMEHLRPQWWDAHEIGHLITVPRRSIGAPLFDLEIDVWPESAAFDRSAAYELAAIDVSRRLLLACGRPDLVDAENQASDYDVMHYGSWVQARQIMRRRGVLRLPWDRTGLEHKIILALDT